MSLAPLRGLFEVKAFLADDEAKQAALSGDPVRSKEMSSSLTDSAVADDLPQLLSWLSGGGGVALTAAAADRLAGVSVADDSGVTSS